MSGMVGMIGMLQLLQGYVLLVLAYLFFPLLGAFLEGVHPLPTPKTGKRERSFALLIPAHNEERVLPKLLESIRSQRYERCEVFVVADNCADHTFEIARDAGVRVFERKTAGPSTKSQALRFLFETTAGLQGWDAVVILDADNLLKSGFLEAVDDEMTQGYQVVQGLRKPKNPFSSRSSTLDYLSEAVSHRVGSAGRRHLGLTGTISGSGIAYRRDLFARLLEETKDTLVEDCEWQLRLMLERIPVRFAPQAVILDEKTDNFHDLTVQRTRWISGKYRLIPRYLPLFLRSLLTRGRGLDGCLYLLSIPPRSIFLAATLCFLGLSLVGFPGILPVWPWVMATWILYLLAGMMLEGAPRKAYAAALFLPLWVGRLVLASILALRPRTIWIPTAHKHDGSVDLDE